jgi:hypothetical protein
MQRVLLQIDKRLLRDRVVLLKRKLDKVGLHSC